MPIFHHIKSFLKSNGIKYIGGVLLLIGVDLLQLLTPLLTGGVIDHITSDSPSMTIIIRYGILIVIFTLGVALGRVGWRLTIISIAKNLEYYIRKKVFKKLTGMDQNYFNTHNTGDIMARCTNDIGTIRQAFGQGTILIVDSLFMSILAITLMATRVDPKLTAMALIPLPLVAVVILGISKTVGKRFKVVQEAFSDISDKAQESFGGIRIIKSFVQEKINLHFFNESNRKNLEENLNLVKVHGFLHPFVSTVALTSLFITVYFGGNMVIKGEVTLGELVSFMSLIGMMTWPMMALGFVLSLMQRGYVSLVRINEILNDTQEVIRGRGIETLNDYSLEVRDLTFTYPGEKNPVLENISFKLDSGKSLAIVGGTGSGKSTLVELFIKTYEVPDKTIFIGGKDINDLDLGEIREAIGYVPQNNFLFSKTIGANIAFNTSNIDLDRTMEMSKVAMVYNEINDLEKKFDTELGERGVNLSGGQKQRISIARAFYNNPEIIILDDSLSAVDTKTEDRILHHIREELVDKTAILISHRISTVRDADKILVLGDGKVIERGTHESLIEGCGYYRSLYERQLLEEKILEE
jgi:ATP-binding cassette, subfamily B, multidrug efflux pump